MKLKVLFHDHCFDGAASAAIFTTFFKQKLDAKAAFELQGVSHKPGGEGIDAGLFTGDQNAVVDFRYSADPRLTWWFDHHQSAFQGKGDEEHFRADRSGRKFHDPAAKSCAGFLSRTCQERFGFDPAPLAELIHWAEIIDSARFESPQAAVELAAPALRLMMVIEASKDPAFGPWLIPQLTSNPLAQLVEERRVQSALGPLLSRHQEAIELVRSRARLEHGVVFFDLFDSGFEAVNKFISYFLYPEAAYTVWIGRAGKRPKISVGANPWRPELRRHDLSKLAEPFGGGGHPVVAGVSFHEGEIETARSVAQKLLATLCS